MSKDYTILNVVEIQGKQYAVIDVGPAYVRGMFAKYIVVPMSSIDNPLKENVRVHDEDS